MFLFNFTMFLSLFYNSNNIILYQKHQTNLLNKQLQKNKWEIMIQLWIDKRTSAAGSLDVEKKLTILK